MFCPTWLSLFRLIVLVFEQCHYQFWMISEETWQTQQTQVWNWWPPKTCSATSLGSQDQGILSFLLNQQVPDQGLFIRMFCTPQWKHVDCCFRWQGAGCEVSSYSHSALGHDLLGQLRLLNLVNLGWYMLICNYNNYMWKSCNTLNEVV